MRRIAICIAVLGMIVLGTPSASANEGKNMGGACWVSCPRARP